MIAYTVRETAQELRVHEETVRRWIRAGLPVINVGSAKRPSYRIETQALVDWLAGRGELPPAPAAPAQGGTRAKDDWTARLGIPAAVAERDAEIAGALETLAAEMREYARTYDVVEAWVTRVRALAARLRDGGEG